MKNPAYLLRDELQVSQRLFAALRVTKGGDQSDKNEETVFLNEVQRNEESYYTSFGFIKTLRCTQSDRHAVIVFLNACLPKNLLGGRKRSVVKKRRICHSERSKAK